MAPFDIALGGADVKAAEQADHHKFANTVSGTAREMAKWTNTDTL